MLSARRSAALAACAAAVAVAGVAPSAARAADTTPPTVELRHPGGGGLAWGTTSIAASASDAESGIAHVDFYVDGTQRAIDTSAPYTYAWDASQLAAGTTHTLAVRAYDGAGNSSDSPPATVTIARQVPLGAALSSGWLDSGNAGYRTALTRFSSVTPAGELKMDWVQPQQGQWNFGASDSMLAWAEQNGKAFRGHTLIWGHALPGWVTSGSWTRDQAIGLLQTQIRTVMGRYRGRIKVYDVVNEAINWDGSWRQNFWYGAIGPDYVEIAFRTARAADPDAKLYYNDYSAEGMNPKSDAILRMVTDFRQRGVPIDGVGFQAHAFKSFQTNRLAENMSRFTALGVETEITEMDVKWSELDGSTTNAKLQAQASLFRRYAHACQVVAGCRRMTTWGVGDPDSWLGPGEAPLLFDTGYAAKPSFAAVDDELGLAAGPAVPPETTIAGGPAADPSDQQTASFSLSSDDPAATFECRLNGGAWGGCSAQPAYSGLADGTYTFQARSRDLTGNADPTPASRTWTVAGGGAAPGTVAGPGTAPPADAPGDWQPPPAEPAAPPPPQPDSPEGQVPHGTTPSGPASPPAVVPWLTRPAGGVRTVVVGRTGTFTLARTRVSCPEASAGCSLRALASGRGRHAAVRVAKGTHRLASGRTSRVSLRLTRAGTRLLRRERTAAVAVHVTLRTTSDSANEYTVAVRLRRAR